MKISDVLQQLVNPTGLQLMSSHVLPLSEGGTALTLVLIEKHFKLRGLLVHEEVLRFGVRLHDVL
jgi:hypothetical protein